MTNDHKKAVLQNMITAAEQEMFANEVAASAWQKIGNAQVAEQFAKKLIESTQLRKHFQDEFDKLKDN